MPAATGITPARSPTGTACCWSRRCSPSATFQDGATSAAASSRTAWSRTRRIGPADWCWRWSIGPARQEGRPLAYSLLGHSAGGQFLERLAAFVPTQAKRIVVANPGSYVFPSLDVAAPYGLGKVYAGAEGEAQLRRYLEQPLTIYLGEADTRVDDAMTVPRRVPRAPRVTSAA